MGKKLNYIDIFAGCGGISLGLYNTGHWEGLFAIERNEDAFYTLKHNLIEKKVHFNWPDWLPCKHNDIYKIISKYKDKLESLKGKVDLVVGGPPCQGFSFAGKRSESDERNKLVLAYIDFVKLIMPKVILFENVRGFNVGFKRKDGERGKAYSNIVMDELRNVGYDDVQFKIVNFSDFGVPQNRQRLIIVASLEKLSCDFFDLLYKNKSLFFKTKGLTETPKLGDAISDLEKRHGVILNGKFEKGLYSKRPLSSFQNLMRHDIKNENPDSHRFANHSDVISEKYNIIIENKLTGKQIREQFNTKKLSIKLLYEDTICPTLTTLPDDYIHYSEPRILTVREYARVQSFPDWYEIKGKYTTGGKRRSIEIPRYSQIGNAVPPLFSEYCGTILKEVLKNGE
jgi:DNA (cytosine-5)-methyltransferase 1